MTSKPTLLALLLCGCPVDTRPVLDQVVNGRVTVPNGKSARLRVLTTWKSTRGEQYVSVNVAADDDQDVRTTLALVLPGGQTVQKEDVEKNIGVVEEPIACTHRRCEMELAATLTFEDLRDTGSEDRVIAWQLGVAVGPREVGIDLNDLVFDVSEPDGGAP